ncbi:unnamed protein product [Clavelina lepadiformis]|uniref:Uncharacterized protein n=1 Tax=Clavelina lepadiformis TaxID=159417 RepID=A0ABP0H6A7_CLALP
MKWVKIYLLSFAFANAIAYDHTIVAPKFFRLGAPEKVVLCLHGYDSQVSIAGYLQDWPHRRNTFSIYEQSLNVSSSQLIELPMQVNSENIWEFRLRQKVALTIEVSNSQSDFTKEVIVSVSKQSGYLFVITDRPAYRPNEGVGIRVFPLDQVMRKETEHKVLITVKTPQGIGVFRKNISFPPEGFIETQYPISDIPITGRCYGKPVTGNYFLSMKLKRSPDDKNPEEFYRKPSGYYRATIDSGNEIYEVTMDRLREVLLPNEALDELVDNKATILITATVRGEADGVLETGSSSPLPLLRSPYTIDTKRTSRYYLPGHTYHLQADVKNALNLENSNNVKVKITVSGHHTFYDTDDRGRINCPIDFNSASPHSQEYQIEIKTNDTQYEIENQATKSFMIQPYTSPSNSYLQISLSSHLTDVGSHAFFITFDFNRMNNQIQYYVISRGTIVAYGIKQPLGMQSTQRLEITQKMVPSARVVAYYLHGTEVVSNSVWFEVRKQCKERLHVDVTEHVLPGQRTDIHVTGPPNALVSISGVDRAAYFLFGDNRLNRDEMFTKMKSYDQGCYQHGGANGQSVFKEAGLSFTSSTLRQISLECDDEAMTRQKRQILRQPEDTELEAMLKKCEVSGKLSSAITDEDCESRAARCNENYGQYPGCTSIFKEACIIATRERLIARLRGHIGRSANDNDEAEISQQEQRSDFKESLFFTYKTLDEQGRCSYSTNSRHSITTYDIDAVSMTDSEDGFCIAEPAELLVFKNVFIQLYTPYSLKKGEQAVLRFTVFNYGKRLLQQLQVEVKVNEERSENILCSAFPPGDWTHLTTLDVEPENSASGHFVVLPLRVPDDDEATVQIRVKNRQLENQFEQIWDSVEKKILIEEPGEHKDTFKSYPIDLKNDDRQKIDVKFDFPNNTVSNTTECWLYAYANFLGPLIEIDPLEKKPRDIASYTRQLTFLSNRVKQRAFSVWVDREPSTWLNAFADKVYLKAYEYANDIEMGPICSSLNWLLGEQERDGAFRENGEIIHREMHGAIGGRLTLTAYVLITLLESQSPCSSELNNRIQVSVENAVTFLQRNKDDETFQRRPYALAILSYALALHNRNSRFFREVNNRLLALRRFDGTRVFWKGRPENIAGTDIHAYWYKQRPQAVDVEATAYALLAQIQMAELQHSPRQDTLDLTRNIVLWLIEQRNEGGAFLSTQDTVIGLQALATYQMWVEEATPERTPVNIHVNIPSLSTTSSNNFPAIFLDKTNDRYRIERKVPKSVFNKGNVTVIAAGTGEGVLSYRCVYRTVVDEDSCHFNITFNINELDENEQRENKKIKLTV